MQNMEGEPFFAGGWTLIPYVLLQNHMEMFATQASNCDMVGSFWNN